MQACGSRDHVRRAAVHEGLAVHELVVAQQAAQLAGHSLQLPQGALVLAVQLRQLLIREHVRRLLHTWEHTHTQRIAGAFSSDSCTRKTPPSNTMKDS